VPGTQCTANIAAMKNLNRPSGAVFRAGALLVSDDLAGVIYRISYSL
jgi:glucose/arabinose dehydrogenase